MEHHGKDAYFTQLVTRWVEALIRSSQFLQQVAPGHREFPPAAAPVRQPCSSFDFAWRLYGVRPSGCVNHRSVGDRKQIATLRRIARIVTTTGGKPVRLIATEPRAVTVLVQNGGSEKAHNLKPDSEIAL